MASKDTRWMQRFRNYQKALTQLSRFVGKEELNEMEEQGLIQAFEYTFELAWKTLQDFFGYLNIKGPRPVIMQAFQDGHINNGEKWMEMLLDRNRTTHTYNEEIAHEIITAIKNDYFDLLIMLRNRLQKLLGSELN